ncbi:hypothetical protein GINT2_001772 [Glugoides intestinalis]
MYQENNGVKENPKTIEEAYDYLIVGTGLVETAISSILSEKKYRILHIDTAHVYGNEFSTLQYNQLLEHFGVTDGSPEFITKTREFNIDLTPKLLLQDSPMKDFLLKSNIQDIVTFTSIKGSYLFTDKQHSVPTNEAQALRSSAVSMMQKYKVINFFWNARNYYKDGITTSTSSKTMKEEFKAHGLSNESMDFIGHAIALNLDDKYLERPALITYKNIFRYVSSIACYENSDSPYIYPLYGLSELCQAFARKASLHGAVFMLKAEIVEINEQTVTVRDPDGEIRVIKAKRLIADPKYWPDSKVEKEVIRCIILLKKGYHDSRNIIFLKRQLKRQHDVFCVVLGHAEGVCPEGYEVAILSTVRETEEPPKEEIEAVLKNFNGIADFIEIRKIFTNESTGNVYFTKNVDESALLDNVYDDIVELCEKLEL